MILVTITINATDHQISTEHLPLETFWDAKIASASNVAYNTRTEHGGYVEPQFGDLDLLPDLFEGVSDWPPPDVCPVVIEYTETNEADAVELFRGTAYLQSFNRSSVSYQLHGKEYDSYVADGTSINATLNSIFTTYCGATYLNLTLNTTKARASSPATVYTTSGRKLTLDFLSEVAAFHCHQFYIVGSTLYLVDMKLDNGTDSIEEGDLFEAVYNRPPAYSLFVIGARTLKGSNNFGVPFTIAQACHTTAANVDVALADMKTVMERPSIELRKPMGTAGTIPLPGANLDWTDESTLVATVAEMWARDIVFDFDTEELVITGDGVIT